MITVLFYNYGCGSLDVEKELGINCDIDVFLMDKILGISLEATDNQNDMADNALFYFSSNDEPESVQLLDKVIKELLPSDSEMQYIVKIE